MFVIHYCVCFLATIFCINSFNSFNELSLFKIWIRCPICLDDYNSGTEICVIPCCHSFHATCILMWEEVRKLITLSMYFQDVCNFLIFLIYQIMSRTPNKFSGFTFSMLLVTPQNLALA